MDKMLSKDKVENFLQEADIEEDEDINFADNEILAGISAKKSFIAYLINEIESGSLDASPGAEWNQCLDAVLDLIRYDGVLQAMFNEHDKKLLEKKIESLRRPEKSSISPKADKVAEALKEKFGESGVK